MSGDERHSVRQDIGGSGHQIAGRDLLNLGDGFKPDPNNPKLRKCDYCDWPGLSYDAHQCPKCGHNYLADAIAEQERARQERDNRRGLMLGALILGLSGAFYLAHWLQLELAQGAGLLLIILLSLWLGWTYIMVRFELWWANRKRRKKGWDD